MIKFITKSLILAFLIVSTAVTLGYFIYVSAILMWMPPQNLGKYDAIIALTGAKGRIETAFSLLSDNHAEKLLISGVRRNVTFDDLVKNNADNLSDKDIQDIRNHCCITLDYIADTTETNAVESARWIADNDVQSILLVTSASHMPRAYLLFHRILDSSVAITSYPYQSKRRLSLVMSLKFWQYAFREYTKFGGNLIRLERQ